MVGSCYVTRGDDEPDAEFGGIIIRDGWKGTGLASAIGTVAIAAHFLRVLGRICGQERGWASAEASAALLRSSPLERRAVGALRDSLAALAVPVR